MIERVVIKQKEGVASSLSFRAAKENLCLTTKKAQRRKKKMKTFGKTKKKEMVVPCGHLGS